MRRVRMRLTRNVKNTSYRKHLFYLNKLRYLIIEGGGGDDDDDGSEQAFD
jgi:hypothetical protein